MFLKLGTTKRLTNSKKYLKILAISLKDTCEGVYILHPPAYFFRDIRSGCFYNNDSRFNSPLEMTAFFSGHF